MLLDGVARWLADPVSHFFVGNCFECDRWSNKAAKILIINLPLEVARLWHHILKSVVKQTARDFQCLSTKLKRFLCLRSTSTHLQEYFLKRKRFFLPFSEIIIISIIINVPSSLVRSELFSPVWYCPTLSLRSVRDTYTHILLQIANNSFTRAHEKKILCLKEEEKKIH